MDGVSDDDTKKVYEKRKNKLSTPERRQLPQIMFPNIAEAQAAREKNHRGTSFDDIAKERGLNRPTSTSVRSRNPRSSIQPSPTPRSR